MDRVTKSLMDDFVQANGLVDIDEAQAFEHFAGSMVTSMHYSESFSSEDIHVGGGGDSSIDTIGIIVNGNLVTEPEEIEDLLDANSFLDVTFVIVQAERGTSFDSSKIGQFGYGVKDFFSDAPKLRHNDSLAIVSRIVSGIYQRSNSFRKGNPQCFLYYVTTGRWQEPAELVARKDAAVNDLEELNIFRGIAFECVDANRLQRLCQDAQNALATDVQFVQKTVLPDLPNVEQAYLGVLPAKEFLKLIKNPNDEVVTSVFYDNIRHWQEWNPVNSEIRDTLKEELSQVYFPLLNNGVTIVAKQVTATGNKFHIEDYQIVNGCQTSYVLYETRDKLTDEVYVPVRLIATENTSIRNAIIKATNRQTQVPDDQLFALSDFPKGLERYFQTFEGSKRLYYERRSRQYAADSNVEKVRIVDLKALVRAYASMFLEFPHRTTRNYKALVKSFGTDIFGQAHKLEPYYVAAYAHYKLEYLFRNQHLQSTLKPARHHLLLAYRMLAKDGTVPPPNSKEMVKFCEDILDTLWDDSLCRNLFDSAAERVRSVADGNLHRDNIRTETFTVQLKDSLQQADAD